MTTEIDLADLDLCLRRAISLLRSRFLPTKDGDGGWYHQLDGPNPGATATAVALLVFDRCDQTFDNTSAALKFLRRAQIDSTDPLLDGGLATNTSQGQPVVEATAWVARMTGATRSDLAPGGPDGRRAVRWLVANQNPDGGWGSARGNPSRVWLTCLALRGLLAHSVYEPAVARGVQWLLSSRGADPAAWGQTAADPPSLAHTAMVLLTLAEVRPLPDRDMLKRAYVWLSSRLDPATLYEHAQETYLVAAPGGGTFRLALWHYGTPLAVAALLRHPDGPAVAQLVPAVRTIIAAQSHDGHWPSVDGGASMSLWGVWSCTLALREVALAPLAGPRDVVVWLPNAVVVRRDTARRKSLSSLVTAPRRQRVRQFLGRRWAVLVMLTWVVAGAAAVFAGRLTAVEFAVGLLFPLTFYALDTVSRRKAAQPAPAPGRGAGQ